MLRKSFEEIAFENERAIAGLNRSTEISSGVLREMYYTAYTFCQHERVPVEFQEEWGGEFGCPVKNKKGHIVGYAEFMPSCDEELTDALETVMFLPDTLLLPGCQVKWQRCLKVQDFVKSYDETRANILYPLWKSALRLYNKRPGGVFGLFF